MKVKKLIDELKKFNPDANVFIYDFEVGEYMKLEDVDEVAEDQVDLNVSSESPDKEKQKKINKFKKEYKTE